MLKNQAFSMNHEPGEVLPGQGSLDAEEGRHPVHTAARDEPSSNAHGVKMNGDRILALQAAPVLYVS
eukprot:948560-Amphidinium_carterae.1